MYCPQCGIQTEMNTPITQAIPESPRMKAEPEMTSVTEHTTRELR
jgi:hypothetical protein